MILFTASLPVLKNEFWNQPDLLFTPSDSLEYSATGNMTYLPVPKES